MDSPTNSLQTGWKVWVHMPNERNWDIGSYKSVSQLTTVEQVIEFCSLISDCTLNKCMVFVMKDPILPMWEDENNVDGGAYSFKVPHKAVPEAFRGLLYRVVGGTISPDVEKVHGISVSPKKQFSIIKVWVGKGGETAKIECIDALMMKGSKGIYKRHKGSS